MGNYCYIPESQKDLVVRVLRNGLSPSEVVQATGFSRRTIGWWNQNMRPTGRTVRDEGWRGRVRTLNSADLRSSGHMPMVLLTIVLHFLESLIQRTPDIYLSVMQKELEDVRGVSHADNSRNEDERDFFKICIHTSYNADQLVFLDEAVCNCLKPQRRMGLAPVRNHARHHGDFIRNYGYSLLPAISLDGVIHLGVTKDTWNEQHFRGYIEVLLDKMNPFPERNSVLIMDNALLHKIDGITDIVEACDCRLYYLPHNSPHFNPIEEGFSTTNAWIRRNRDFILDELGEPGRNTIPLIWDIVYDAMSSTNIRDWYAHVGFVP